MRTRTLTGAGVRPAVVGIDVRRATWWPQLGISRYTRGLLQAMVAERPPELELRPLDVHGSPSWQELRAIRVGRGHGYAARLVQEQLTMLAASRRLDLLHLPWSEGPVRPVCPLVLTVHDLATLAPRAGYSLRFRAYYNALLRAHVARAARVIVPSAATAEAFLSRWPRRRCEIVPSGVDAVFTRAAPPPAQREPVIVYTGGFDARKRLPQLLSAFALVADAEPQARLVITGRAPTEVIAAVAAHPARPRIALTGFLPDAELAAQYAAARVGVYPSALEGFGFPVVEAQASGTPVVARASGAIPEVAGDGALLVTSDAPAALAEALLDVLRDDELSHRLGVAGRRNALRFDWSATARRTIEIYREVTDF